jgi:hypothetical protein
MNNLKFDITCNVCGVRCGFNPNAESPIRITFRKGGSAIKNRIVILCLKCANKEAYDFEWPQEV